MRRLLIRLVALETALMGWLGYWLFLVYANNPSISQGLAAQLGRFPQLSFTTVDISILVIIAGLSIFLAFKFQRGLRPGIRLERALQMLENLMKRNLVLEAQVAELKLEKAHVGLSQVSAQPAEPRSGSWERAFRTPIEAGPAVPGSAVRSSASTFGENVFEQSPILPVPPPRVEQKPVAQTSIPVQIRSPLVAARERSVEKPGLVQEKGSERPLDRSSTQAGGFDPSTWEDSPKRVSETTRILNPSPVPRGPAGLVPSSGSKQPYIPVPVPKNALPSVIVGPGGSASPSQVRPAVRPFAGPQVAPKGVVAQPGRVLQSVAGKPPGPLIPIGFSNVKSQVSEARPVEPAGKGSGKEGSQPQGKPPAKPLKKFPYEED